MENKELNKYREKIDKIDQKLINLINKRAKIAEMIGKLKKKMDLPIYQKDREIHVYKKIKDLSNLIDEEDVEKIWKEIINACRKIQE